MYIQQEVAMVLRYIYITVLCFPIALYAHPRYTLISPNIEVSGDFGRSVSGGGDVNNDGYDDIIVGARNENSQPGVSATGRVYVFNGRTGNLLYQLVSPNEEASGHFGYSVAFIGDVNGNGCDDFAVGANWEEDDIDPASSGRAYLFEGLTGDLLHTLESGLLSEHGNFGISIAAAGDVDNDTIGDVIVGAYQENEEAGPENAGRAHVFSGATGSRILSLVSPNEQYNGRFGWSVSSMGDINGDNHDDLLVGAYGETPGPGPSSPGAVYVFSGATGDTLYTVYSPLAETTGYFGWSVSGTGDFNDDATRDIIAGGIFEEPGGSPYAAGRAHVFSGVDGAFIRTMVSPNEMESGLFGSAVFGVSDMDGDTVDDYLISASDEFLGIEPENTGIAYLFSGSSGSLIMTFIPPNPETDGCFGGSLCDAGDVNGDGYSDIIVGAEEENAGGVPDAGRAYIYSPGTVVLSCYIDGGSLVLDWTPWTYTDEIYAYWIYGADNTSYFTPVVISPYTFRQDMVDHSIQTWQSSQGLNDPDNNWTYVIVAVDEFDQMIYQSNRVGEWEYTVVSP